MPSLVLLRHGQSLWNLEGRFTGWMDIDLSDKGREEARRAGELLKSCGCSFDAGYTSVLKRAIRTLWIALDQMGLLWIPVHRSWRLNERSYGALQGVSKREAVDNYGDAQVHRWRRGYHDMPPAIEATDPRYPGADPRYRSLGQPSLVVPLAESLETTLERLIPLWMGRIGPDLREGRRVFITAHGNSLRALVKQIEGFSDEEIEGLEMPTGVPLVYDLDRSLRPTRRFYLLSYEDCRDCVGRDIGRNGLLG